MKNIFILIVFLIMTLLFSCRSQKNVLHKNIDTTYYAEVKKYGFTTLYTLVLNKDNTFSFSIKVQDGNQKCKGNWKIEDNEFLILECGDTNTFEILTNGYMDQREYIMQIINENKLKYIDIVLKRQTK